MAASDQLRDAWGSLGIAFNSQNHLQVDPETALIALVQSQEFPDDKKIMSLALLWLRSYSKLVHIERLKTHAKKLQPLELAILGSIAMKCVANGDHKWQTIVRLAEIGKLKKNFGVGDSEAFIKMRGLDKEFAEFGIRVAPILPDDPKKLFSRQKVLKGNQWLRSRLLFGVNMRADIATVLTLNLAETGYAAAKLLGCSANTAYRNWNELEEAGWPDQKNK
jgi:hypothetical protein